MLVRSYLRRVGLALVATVAVGCAVNPIPTPEQDAVGPPAGGGSTDYAPSEGGTGGGAEPPGIRTPAADAAASWDAGSTDAGSPADVEDATAEDAAADSAGEVAAADAGEAQGGRKVGAPGSAGIPEAVVLTSVEPRKTRRSDSRFLWSTPRGAWVESLRL